MRILQVTESLEVGGAERGVATLANELRARHRVSVVCLKQAGALAASLDPDIDVLCIGKREGQDPQALWRLVQLFRQERPDVVHAHDWGTYLDVMIAARLAGVPVVVHTVHGRYMSGGHGWLAILKRQLRHALERFVAARAGHIVCVSEPLREHVEEEVGIASTRTCTIHNGIRIDQAPLAAASLHAGMTFIAVGRLAPVKNFALMIRAFAAARSVDPSLTLRIVGDGPERPALESLTASLQLSGQVEFLGFRSDIDALLRSADVFLLSSTSEGIPMSILEAMRCGLPVISTDVGGVATLVEQGVTGLLVPVATDRDTGRAMGAAGHDLARQRFSIDAMVEAYEQLYAQPCRPGQSGIA